MTTRGKGPWPAAAARISEILTPAGLHPSVVSWAQARPKAERWAIALSGGADSVALLLLLVGHFPGRLNRLVALHFDHRLRGAESTADARFCRRACAGLGVEFLGGRWVAGPGDRSEAEARKARFAFFDACMAARRIRVLWLGHQQDDVAETLLMRLARGSGTSGLSAPRPVHCLAWGKGGRERVHLRPLLGLKKAEIKAVLLKAGAPWREDSSNRKDAHFRNRLRRSVIPRWVRASERDALAGAALSRELLEEDDSALEAWVDSLACLGADGSLSLARLARRPRAVVRRALYRWILAQPKASTLSRQGFETLLSSVERGLPARHSLGRHGFAVIRGKRLKFERVRKTATSH